MTDDKCYPKPGDLIEIKRRGYQHWALYMGNGHVIHVTDGDEGAPSLSVSFKSVFTGTVMVKKELLEEVVGSDEWCVNNKYDCHRTPLPEEEIIRRAEGYIGKEMPSHFFLSNSDHFVTKLRYGGLLRAFVGGEVHIPDMMYDKCYPKPGDLIEIKRRGYQHWALYVGNGYVIHVTDGDENAPPVSASTETRFTKKMMVKKQMLEEVAGNDDWDVNNEYDCSCTPLPVEEIIWLGRCYVDKEVPYRFVLSKSEQLLKKLRYGGLLRAFVVEEMQTPDMTDDKYYPKPGDLIEIKRRGYQHWALYVGNGHVIHVTDGDENAPPVSASTVTIFTRKARVKKKLLKEVVLKNKWDVNNKYEHCRAPFPVEEIIRRAERWIDREVPYDLLGSNCEHFVTELRYGEGVSDQVSTALKRSHGISAAVAGIGAAGISAVFSPPLVAAAGVSLLATIGFGSGNIAHYFIRAKFFKAQRDILEQRCC